MSTQVRPLGPREKRWSVASLGMLWALIALPASAQFTYIDSANPVGIPDLTQRNEPICAAAAMANTFWEWSNHAPFNGVVFRLFFHTDQANFATNWGNDSISETLQMAHHIFGEHPTQTRLTANHAGGATNLNVSNTAGFAVGSVVFVRLDSGDQLVTSIAALPTPGAPGVIQIAAALPSPSSLGQLVETGARTGGRGARAGALTFARNKKLAFNANTQPNGLSVQERLGWARYSDVLALVTPPVVQNAVLGVKWYQADGTVLRSRECTAPPAAVGLPCNGNAACDMPLDAGNGVCGPLRDVYHAVTLAGLDDTAKRIAISNPWGDHRAGNPDTPVSTADEYYNKYTLHLADIMFFDRITIKRAVAENTGFVSAFDAPTGQVADQIRVVALWRVKKGASPHVTGTVVGHPASQTVRYLVANPDSSSDIYHVYLLLDGDAIDVALAASAANSWLASNEPDWQVEVLDPNSGAEADLFDVTNANDPDLTPAYGLGAWSSGAQGLHFSTISQPVMLGGSVELGLEMPGLRSPAVWSDVYIVATEDRSESWAGVTLYPGVRSRRAR